VLRSEKRWLVVGVAIGLTIGVLLVGAAYDRPSLKGMYDLLKTGGHRPPLQGTKAEAAPEPTEPSDTNAELQLSNDEQKAIGIETVEVQRENLGREITAPGKIAEPETGIGMISARISGRVEKLFVKVTGEAVNRDQAVAIIYSPEIFTAGEEYRLALENRQRLSGSKESQALSDADELVRASRRRLEIRGLTAQQIEELDSSSEKKIEIATYSPVGGIVTKRNVSEGQYVKEGDVLFEVTDLSTVWVQADIFESDIPLVRAGQKVRITAPTLAGGSTSGTISFLQPSVDPQSRTMSARIQVPNLQMRLRPGMFVQVSLNASLGTDVVSVPRSAVLDTGKERVVYVAKENGVFEKRSIEGSIADEHFAVTSGVKPGERVVTHGNFLIDSQTRLTGNISGMFGGSKAFAAETAPQAANYKVVLRSDPAPLKGGSEATFHVSVTGSDGKAVSDADVQMALVMPAMPGMGELRSAVTFKWNGSEYVGSGPVAMAGPWTATVEARRGGQLLGVYRTRFDAK
jgi:membrane fusion protein, copper/silver efflux system